VTEPSNLVKVVAAFVAGVVMALGGALVFVRVGDLMHPLAVAQTHPAAASAPAEPAEPEAEPERSTPDVQSAQTAESKGAESSPQPASPERVIPPPKPAVKKSTLPVKRSKPQAQAVVAAVKAPDLPASVPGSTSAVLDSAVKPAHDAPAHDANPTERYGASPAGETAPPTRVKQPHIITLQPGTTLAIRLGEPLSTDHNYAGDTFRGVLDSSVVIDGFIIAEKGSKILGRVVEAQRAGRVQGSAVLSLALTEINTTDGQRIPVNTNSVIARGPLGLNADALKIATGAAIGAIIGAISGGGKGAAIGAGAGGAAGTSIVLATRGRPTNLPTESQLSFQLSEPITITERLN
jgi:hypothetical protein